MSQATATYTRELSLPALARWAHVGALMLVLAIGAYLRLTGLGAQSLWFDEADIVMRAQRSWSHTFETFTAAGENGPLYNVLLAAWVRIAGSSEAAVRFPSAVAGALSLPAMYLLGRRLAGRQVGLIAAGLLAVNPYHIWYSQEAKMYAIVTLLAILSALLLVEALDGNDRRLWAAYVVVTTAMFYTHVATVLVFAAQVVFVALTYRKWHGRWRSILIAAACLTVPYIPIALWALKVVGGDVTTWHADIGLIEALKTVGIHFATFRSEPEVEYRAGWLYFLIALAGVVWLLLNRRSRPVGILLVGLALIPVIGLYVVSLRNSVFSDRYIIVALPAYLLLCAVALATLGRTRLGTVAGIIVATLLVSYTWVPVADVNRSDIAQKEDWRGAYARIAERAGQHDVFLLQPGYMISTLAYYGQQDERLAGHPVATIAVFDKPWITRETMIEELREEIGAHRRVWLIESPERVPFVDPNGELTAWLNATGQLLWEDRVNGVHIALYELPESW